MSSETALSRWLQAEMPRRGYPLEGHRAGGISRLAEDTGIPQATMSRLVNGRTDPSLEQCRKIARLFNLSLDEVLIRAELADPEDFHFRRASADEVTIPPGVSVPPTVSLPSLKDWERRVWVIPGLSVEARRAAILFLRLHEGDLADDTRSLLRLTHILNRVVGRHLEREQDPPQAS